MTVVGFDKVFAEEIEAINTRRERLADGRPRAELEQERDSNGDCRRDPDGNPILRPTTESQLIGLALSGGGVRSAAFSLGVLQALEERNVLNRVDYLSTVSGGGYIGTAMVAAMSKAKDSKFPFPSQLEPEELLAMRHIRDHSNYLFPRGKIDLFNNLAIYLRGLVANAILLLPFLLAAAALTLWRNPTIGDLVKVSDYVPLQLPFGVTLLTGLVILALLALWAVHRSRVPGNRDVGAGWTAGTAFALLFVLVVAACELQPLILAGMFELRGQEFVARLVHWGGIIAIFLAPFSVLVGFLGTFLARLVKRGTENPKLQARVLKFIARAAMYLAAATVPLVLWIVYLLLSYWGLCIASPEASECTVPGWVAGIFKFARTYISESVTPLQVYLGGAVLFFIIQTFFNPNANSLHRLYRDRLSKAFLFNPIEPVEEGFFFFYPEAVGTGAGDTGSGGPTRRDPQPRPA